MTRDEYLALQPEWRRARIAAALDEADRDPIAVAQLAKLDEAVGRG